MDRRVGGGRLRLRPVLVACALSVLALGVRALPSRTVFLEGRVQPFGNDAFYHLRRIFYSVLHFPAVLDFDPYLNFPHGAKAIWSHTFDWLVAAAARPFVLGASHERLLEIAMWIPPVLGAATVVALYAVARRHFAPGVAGVAGLALAVSSAHFWYSQVGFLDHHVAVALTSVGILAASMGCLRRHQDDGIEGAADPPRASGASLLHGAGVGLVFAAALLVWPGSLLHLGLCEAGLLLYLVTRARRAEARSFARRLGVAHAAGGLLLAPFCLGNEWPQWSRFSPVVLSDFQPALFAGLAALAFGCDGLWSRRRFGKSARRRALSAVALGGALLALFAAALPGLAASGLDAWQWFAKEDAFQGSVAESAPLLVHQGTFTVEVAVARFSLFVFLLPLALGVGALAARRRADRPQLLLLLGWTAGMLAATLLQRRFFNSASVGVSLVFGWGVCGVYRALPPHWTADRPRRIAIGSLFAAGVLVLWWPMLVGTYTHDLANQLRRLTDRGARIPPQFVRRMISIETARWLRKYTPETSGWMEADARPEYGVLAPWPLGHILQWEARRPTVVDNFGDDLGPENFLLARRYSQSREPEAVEILERLGARYVVVQAQAAYLDETPKPDSMFVALFFHDGTSFEPNGPRGREPAVPALARHRLVFESRPVALGNPDEPSEFKVFELVRGARVSGRAEARAAVSASVSLRTNRRRQIEYQAVTRADDAGRWELRLPYATRGAPQAVRVAPAYVVRSGDASGFLELHESQVREGERVEGPDLRAERETAPRLL